MEGSDLSPSLLHFQSQLIIYISKVSWLFWGFFGNSSRILREFFENSSGILRKFFGNCHWLFIFSKVYLLVTFSKSADCLHFKVSWCVGVMNWHHFREWGILNIRVCVCRSKSWQKSEIWLKGGQGQKWSLEALSWVLALKYWIADWYFF